MRRTWPVWFFLAFSCARKPEPEAQPPRGFPALESGRVEELAREAVGEKVDREPIETDDPLFFRIQEVEEMVARIRAEGASESDAQLRACIAEEDFFPEPDRARLSLEEESALKTLYARAEGPGRQDSIRELASASGATGFRKEALRALGKLLRRRDDAFEVIRAIEMALENIPRRRLPNDLVPTLLGHAGLFHLHDARVRLAAARILGKLADPRAPPFLLRARAFCDDEGFAREAGRALEACSSAAR